MTKKEAKTLAREKFSQVFMHAPGLWTYKVWLPERKLWFVHHGWDYNTARSNRAEAVNNYVEELLQD